MLQLAGLRWKHLLKLDHFCKQTLTYVKEAAQGSGCPARWPPLSIRCLRQELGFLDSLLLLQLNYNSELYLEQFLHWVMQASICQVHHLYQKLWQIFVYSCTLLDSFSHSVDSKACGFHFIHCSLSQSFLQSWQVYFQNNYDCFDLSIYCPSGLHFGAYPRAVDCCLWWLPTSPGSMQQPLADGQRMENQLDQQD